MDTLLIGTRKGLFVMHADHAGHWAMQSHHFAGEPVTQTLADPRTGHWYAALRLGHFGVKLHCSKDHGKTWQEIGCPALPPKPSSGFWADDPVPWNVEMIWSLTAGGTSQLSRLWAGTMPGAVFKSDDSGASWQLCDALWLDEKRKAWVGGGNDYPGIHTLLRDSRDDQHMTAAVSCGGLWETRDDGNTWQSIGQGFKADFVPPEMVGEPNAQDPHRVSVCAAQPEVMWTQLHFGLYRSTDAGQNWMQLQGHPEVGDFGFPILAHPTNPLRAWVVPAKADALRYAPDARMCIARTDDGGKNWQVFRAGLPQSHAYDLVYRHGLALASDAKTLVMASTTGNLWISPDSAEHWQQVSGHLPPVACVEFDSSAQ
jgi:hypothetical protein